MNIDIDKIINQTALAIETLPVDSTTKNFWLNYLYRVKGRVDYSNEEKLKKIQILINNIKSYNEAVYYNSPLVIVKDTLVKTIGDITDKIIQPLEDVGNISLIILKYLPIIILIIAIIYVYFILLKKND